MIAAENVKVDGHTYKVGEEIPDLGSLVCTSEEDNGRIRGYEGKYTDKDKLPKYDDLSTGSSAFLSNNGKFVLYKYYADTKTWEGNGEVIQYGIKTRRYYWIITTTD